METINIFSPQRFVVPNGSSLDDYFGKIIIESYLSNNGNLILKFQKSQFDKFINFIKFVNEKNGSSLSPFTIHFTDEDMWVQASMMDAGDDNTISLKNYKLSGKFVGGKHIEYV